MAFDVEAAGEVAYKTCYTKGTVRQCLRDAVAEIVRLRAELAAMRDFLPDPESCSGWDDADSPGEVAVDLANLARLKGVAESTWPAHIKAAAVRLTE